MWLASVKAMATATVTEAMLYGPMPFLPMPLASMARLASSLKRFDESGVPSSETKSACSSGSMARSGRTSSRYFEDVVLVALDDGTGDVARARDVSRRAEVDEGVHVETAAADGLGREAAHAHRVEVTHEERARGRARS